jgi:O-antigen ligase
MLWVLIGYMFLFIHRPFEVWPTLGDFHVERFYIICAAVMLALAPGKRWLPNWQHLAVCAFAGAVLLCWLVSPWAEKGEQRVEDWFKILVFYFMLVVAVSDEKKLRFLVTGFVVVMFVYQSHSLLEYFRGRYTFRMGIPRMLGVDLTLGDPNSFGNGVVYALPVISALWLSKPSLRVKLLLAAHVALSVVCIALTGSRASFLGLIVWTTVMVLRSRYRWRLLAVVLVLSPLLWTLLPESLRNRFTTIVDPSVGPANAQGSAEGRWHGLMIGLDFFNRYPITGIGPGAWKPASGQPNESHNLYGQVLGETGIVGTTAFASIVVAFAVNTWKIRRAYKGLPPEKKDFLYHLAGGLFLGVVLMLFEGNFGHNLYRFNWLWYGGFLIVARHCVEERMALQALVRPSLARLPVPLRPVRRRPTLKESLA